MPLFKQGDHSVRNNYRPISIIPVAAKLFERIIYGQIYDYLIVNNIITSHQLGFRSLHSTITALLEATDNWAYNVPHFPNLNQSFSKRVSATFLPLSKQKFFFFFGFCDYCACFHYCLRLSFPKVSK